MYNKLTPNAVLDQLNRNGVTHVVWLPDSETNFMFNEMTDDQSIEIVPVCREGESIPIAVGLRVGGMKPIVMIQNTGLFESGDSVRGMALDIDIPLVMIIGYRGWVRNGTITDSAARFTEPILSAWGIKHYLIESDADVGTISRAFKESEETNTPVACLMGAEYS